jgi:hypothetical protein
LTAILIGAVQECEYTQRKGRGEKRKERSGVMKGVVEWNNRKAVLWRAKEKCLIGCPKESQTMFMKLTVVWDLAVCKCINLNAWAHVALDSNFNNFSVRYCGTVYSFHFYMLPAKVTCCHRYCSGTIKMRFSFTL